jgi:hypothetical protein
MISLFSHHFLNPPVANPLPGAPFTLSQAQSHITSSLLGPRISFHLSISPVNYLSTYTGPPYDYVVLSHCIYYFSSPSILPSLIKSLTPHTHSICIAEWSLHSSSKEGVPHVLTALLWTMLESKRQVESMGNIRSALSPAQIKDAVGGEGWQIQKEALVDANEGLRDGYWEVRDVVGSREREMRGLRGVGEKEVAVLAAMWDAIESSLLGVERGVDGVRCMDVWVGIFKKE